MGCLGIFAIVVLGIMGFSSVEAFFVCYTMIGIYIGCVICESKKTSQKNKEITDKLEQKYKSKITWANLSICEQVDGIGLPKGEYRGWTVNDRFCLGAIDNVDNIYLDVPLDDVLGYEKLCEIENKGISLGKAVVGGVLFGGAGAILGGLMGTSKKNEEVVLLIKYKGEEVFLVLSPISLGALQKIMPEKQARPARQTNIQGSKSNQSIDYNELEQLAQLRDKGIITDDEFNLKKKQILGL